MRTDAYVIGLRTGHKRCILERHIAAKDGEIDYSVYALYELTKEGIERATNPLLSLSKIRA